MAGETIASPIVAEGDTWAMAGEITAALPLVDVEPRDRNRDAMTADPTLDLPTERHAATHAHPAVTTQAVTITQAVATQVVKGQAVTTQAVKGQAVTTQAVTITSASLAGSANPALHQAAGPALGSAAPFSAIGLHSAQPTPLPSLL